MLFFFDNLCPFPVSSIEVIANVFLLFIVIVFFSSSAIFVLQFFDILAAILITMKFNLFLVVFGHALIVKGYVYVSPLASRTTQ